MKTAHLAALVTALVIGGAAWFWYAQQGSELQSDAAVAVEQILTGPTGQARQVAALAGAQAAAAAMERLAAGGGGYAEATAAALRAIDPTLDSSVAVVSATQTGYCVQVSLGDAAAHASGPGGIAQAGPCPA